MNTFLRKRRAGYVLAGLVLIGIGCFVFWQGVITPPGQFAITLPKYQDWTVTDAVVVGPLFWALGVYGVVKHAVRTK